MATKEKMQHCAWCGDETGIHDLWPGDINSCGKHECEREIRHQMQAEESERRINDDFTRGCY